MGIRARTDRRFAAACVSAVSAALACAAVAAVGCSSVDSTNFGPPGGLTGKKLPLPSDTGDASGGGSSSSGGAASSSGSSGGVSSSGGSTSSGGGASSSGGSSSGPPADGGSGDAAARACSVSWSSQIFPSMGATGKWKCADSNCHGGFQSPRITTDAGATYTTLAAYTLTQGPQHVAYIVPGNTDPTKSGIECNMSGSSCGPQMPITTGGASLPTQQDIQTIDTWVRCGAPNN